MPSSLPQVADALQHVLTVVPEELARRSGFCQRTSKLPAAVFVQTLVLGWLGNPQASLSEVTHVAAKLGVDLSPQARDQRFTPAATTLLRGVLAAAVAQVLAADPVAVPVLERFAAVAVLDSSTIRLPDVLAGVWAGCGGRTGPNTAAALQLTVRLDLVTGRLTGPELSDGKAQNRASALQHLPLPAGGRRLADLGFWSLEVFRAIGDAGAFWLSRLDLQTGVWVDGARVDLPSWLPARGERVDGPVKLGAARLPARLLAVRVPQAVADERRRKLTAAAKREGRTPAAAKLTLAGWTLLVTNVPAARLTLAEALVLARARWPIELLVTLGKDEGKVDESRSRQPWRVLGEVDAKLTAMVVQHWVLLTSLWRCPDRSLTEAATTVRREATCLVGAIRRRGRLLEALRDLGRCLAVGCRLDHRRHRPNLHQLLTDPALGGVA